jgi:hypothetical protein
MAHNCYNINKGRKACFGRRRVSDKPVNIDQLGLKASCVYFLGKYISWESSSSRWLLVGCVFFFLLEISLPACDYLLARCLVGRTNIHTPTGEELEKCYLSVMFPKGNLPHLLHKSHSRQAVRVQLLSTEDMSCEQPLSLLSTVSVVW